MKAAHAVLERLRAHGIRHLFGLPGSTEAPLLDALVGAGDIRYYLTLHESVAAGMAYGFARATGQPGVASLHTSVGTANALAVLYDAYRDYTPLVALVGHKDTEVLSTGGFCAVASLPEMARQVTKWAWQSLHPERIVHDLERALHLAASAPRGPTLLALPEDFLAAEVPQPAREPLRPISAGRVPARLVEEAARLLAESQRPLVICGSEVTDFQGLAGLAEGLEAPVAGETTHTVYAPGFPSEHPLWVGPYRPDAPWAQGADAILAVGCRLFVHFSKVQKPELPPKACLIHVHPDPAEVGKVYPPHVGAAGDPDLFVADLRAALTGVRSADRAAWRELRVAWQLDQQARVEREQREELARRKPASVVAVVKALAEALGPEGMIFDDSTRSSRALWRYYPVRRPQQLVKTSGGGLGWGLPAALGAQVARPEIRTVAFVGEGAFLFSLQALWTAARYGIPTLTVVLDNGGYLAVKRALQAYGGEAVRLGVWPGAAIGGLDFARLAEGFGVPGVTVDEPEQVKQAIRDGLGSGGPYLVAVRVAEYG